MITVKETKNVAIATLVINDFVATTKNTNFLAESLSVEELKKLSNTLKAEIIFTRNNYAGGMEFKTEKIWKDNMYDCQDIFTYDDYLLGLVENIYYINEENIEKEDGPYIYDEVTDVCYKVRDSKIGKYTVHSLEYAKLVLDGVNSNGVGVIDFDVSTMSSSDGVECYEPDLNNFAYATEIVYYSADKKTTKTLNIKDYLEKERPKYIDVGGIRYTFADYSSTNKVWANIKTTANALESYWVWVPRYAYKLGGTTAKPTADVIYVNTENKQFNGNDLPEGYVVHEAFSQNEEMRGIWFSKYNPTSVESVPIDVSEPAIPDLSNFNAENTQLVYYTIDGKNSIKVAFSENPVQSIEQDGVTYYFYNYANKIWANVCCNANGIESYWVWIPRYAYKFENGILTVILVDTNNRPLDTATYGTTLSSLYTVHEAFEQEPGMQGLWFSKYNPTLHESIPVDYSEPAIPDLSNFNAENTQLVYYTIDGKNSIKVAFSENPAQSIEQDGVTYYFYNYANKIWANVYCNANGLESYWVWIPRYAYKFEDDILTVILVDKNNRPLDTATYGTTLSSLYTVHEAFTQEDGLEGIWFSKYNPTKVELE